MKAVFTILASIPNHWRPSLLQTMSLTISTTRAFTSNHPLPPFPTINRTHQTTTMDPSIPYSLPSRAQVNQTQASTPISVEEWQSWGTSSQVPALVAQVIEEMKELEEEVDDDMVFGGFRGKLKGNFKVHEDKKQRAKYQALVDSEEKLQFFSARQIACRLLGSKGYLCQKCWLAMEEDCMCPKINPSSLWPGIRFWLYMHPRDFLRQNNTGKLLWQIFGVQAATLCLYGISEHEEIMWNAFKRAGKNMVWCLYPSKNATPKSVQDIVFRSPPAACLDAEQIMTNGDNALNFILLDGTWNNSAAMFRRLKEQSRLLWDEEDLSCISLASPGVSAMHKLRPQPSWDRTCTAAAAIGLLSEMHLLPELSSYGLDKHANELENALHTLLDALTTRRVRMGRSITRTVKDLNNVF